jgi:hypothetical protein
MLHELDRAAGRDFTNICESNFRRMSFTDERFMKWLLSRQVNLEYADRSISHEAMQCLLPNQMVTDDVLHFLLRFAIERAPRKDRVVHVDSQLLDKFERHGSSALRDCKRQPWSGCNVVVCPIHQGVHWYMVLLFPKSRICWILDSILDQQYRQYSQCYLKCQYTDDAQHKIEFVCNETPVDLSNYTHPLGFVLRLARNHLGGAFGKLSDWNFWLLPTTLHPQQESSSNDCALATFRAAHGVLSSKNLVPSWTPQSCAREDYTQLRRLAFHLILQETLKKQGDAALMQLIRSYAPASAAATPQRKLLCGSGDAGDPMVIS